MHNVDNVSMVSALDAHDLIDKETHSLILKTVRESYLRDIDHDIRWRHRYKIISTFTEQLSRLLTLSSTVIAFAAGYLENPAISFTAGCIGVIAMSLTKLSSYSRSEGTERTEHLNEILSSLGNESVELQISA